MFGLMLLVVPAAAACAAWLLLDRAMRAPTESSELDMLPIAFWCRRPPASPSPILGEIAVWKLAEAPDTFDDIMTKARCRFALPVGGLSIGSDRANDVCVPPVGVEIPKRAVVIEAQSDGSVRVLPGDDLEAIEIDGFAADGPSIVRSETTLVVAGQLLVAFLLYRERCRTCARRIPVDLNPHYPYCSSICRGAAARIRTEGLVS